MVIISLSEVIKLCLMPKPIINSSSDPPANRRPSTVQVGRVCITATCVTIKGPRLTFSKLAVVIWINWNPKCAFGLKCDVRFQFCIWTPLRAGFLGVAFKNFDPFQISSRVALLACPFPCLFDFLFFPLFVACVVLVASSYSLFVLIAIIVSSLLNFLFPFPVTYTICHVNCPTYRISSVFFIRSSNVCSVQHTSIVWSKVLLTFFKIINRCNRIVPHQYLYLPYSVCIYLYVV